MLLHASRLEAFRMPVGAMPVDSNVELKVKANIDADNITLCYTYGLYGFTYHEEPMCLIGSNKEQNLNEYMTKLMLPHEVGLLFYWFRFDFYNDSKYYCFNPDSKNGEGMICDMPPKVGVDEEKYPFAFQITVYDKNFKTPDDLKGAIIYQIFPDRFSRGSDYSFSKMVSASNREERLYHKSWDEDVDIEGTPETGYLACDFYGGTLNGIREKLSYIKELGVDIIYLNPIFEARSSHRYDTADYLNIDPVLGTNKDFVNLVSDAKKLGIRIILDGVFSHTGADSKYFNKFDRYEGIGAYKAFNEGIESPYRSWYSIRKEEDENVTYDCWWGFSDLPNVNEDDLSYRRFIFGEGGVIRTWLSRGAFGFRLDVSDELPDSFIRQMRDTIKEETNGNGVLLGEIWEDATNKCSYGSYRDFLLGRTHDSVMGYPFREALLDFLKGTYDANILSARLEGFRERYPKEAYYTIMNLMSSHDVPRSITMFGDPEDSLSREEQRHIRLSEDKLEHAINMNRLAFAMQIGYVGATAIYYGDEVLMEGYKDPFNRRTYPWGKLSSYQKENLTLVRRVASLRSSDPVLRTGFIETLVAEGDLYIIRRYLVNRLDAFGNKIGSGSSSVILAINRGKSEVYLKLSRGKVSYSYNKKSCTLINDYIIDNIDKGYYGLGPETFVFIRR